MVTHIHNRISKPGALQCRIEDLMDYEIVSNSHSSFQYSLILIVEFHSSVGRIPVINYEYEIRSICQRITGAITVLY